MGHSNCDKCGHDKRMCSCSTFVAQVGGSHYATESRYQHWDWVTDCRMGYLPGNATKYVSRWWNKNGLVDLEKGMSYIKKMQVIRAAKPDYVFNHGFDYTTRVCTDRFVQSAGLTEQERSICEILTGPCDNRMLELAERTLQSIVLALAQGMPRRPITDSPVPRCGAGQGQQGRPAASNSTTGVGGIGHPAPFGYDGEDDGA